MDFLIPVHLGRSRLRIADVSFGQNGCRRAAVAISSPAGDGNLLYAFEARHNDGPFVHPDNYGKINAVLRYSQGDTGEGFSVTGMAYKAKWNATDQITQRAVASQLISSRFDAIDPSDGGNSHR